MWGMKFWTFISGNLCKTSGSNYVWCDSQSRWRLHQEAVIIHVCCKGHLWRGPKTPRSSCLTHKMWFHYVLWKYRYDDGSLKTEKSHTLFEEGSDMLCRHLRSWEDVSVFSVGGGHFLSCGVHAGGGRGFTDCAFTVTVGLIHNKEKKLLILSVVIVIGFNEGLKTT